MQFSFAHVLGGSVDIHLELALERRRHHALLIARQLGLHNIAGGGQVLLGKYFLIL